MKSLKVLDLSNNKINFISEALGNSLLLTELRISGNQIKYIPESIGNLVNLETLDMSKN